jgi:hypothetical protein
MKRVEAYLRTEQGLSATDKGNIRFHVAMAVVALTLGKPKPTVDQISQLDLASVTDARISEATAVVFDEFKKLGATDSIAKSAAFLAKIASRIAADGTLSSGATSYRRAVRRTRGELGRHAAPLHSCKYRWLHAPATKFFRGLQRFPASLYCSNQRPSNNRELPASAPAALTSSI